jgi:ABC-type uncharacterized transport system permease subunit
MWRAQAPLRAICMRMLLGRSGFYGLAHLLVGAGYLALAWFFWHRMSRAQPISAALRNVTLAALLALHATLLAADVAAGPTWRFGFAQALSATLLVALLVIWIEGLFLAVRGMDVLVLPAAAAAVVLPALFSGAPIAAGIDSAALRVHLLAAILAYSVLTIAALHAGLMALLDRRLHAPGVGPVGGMNRVFAQMPSLLALERLLFRLIGAGFVLLTATLISGAVFTEQLIGQPLRFDHKTLFTIVSWLVFAGLLVGRFVFGWRGRTALRWTFAGFLMLMLAYVGSRFVLEVILHRL